MNPVIGAAALVAFIGSPNHHGDLPPGASIIAEVRSAQGRHTDLYVDLPASWLRKGLDEAWLDGFSHRWVSRLDGSVDRSQAPSSMRAYAVDPDAPDVGWQPLTAFLRPQPQVPRRPYEPQRGLSGTPGPPLVSLGQHLGGATPGFLTGKVVYISQAHGFTWNDTLNRWATQRGNTHGIVEDLVNAEGMNHFLMNYLRNAGATVFTVREEDMQTNMVIVDAEPGGQPSVEGGGSYSETGSWADSTAAGFRAGEAPYLGEVNPHALGGTRYATAGDNATATARWTPQIPRDGYYTVYVSYAASSNRVPDAHYVVSHVGGETHFRVNQRRHGNTWIRLGRFWFRAGQDATVGSVSLQNDTELGGADSVVSADAVRFGGGQGDIVRNGTGDGPANGPTSQMPRWRECSRYYSQFMGAPPSVYNAGSSDGSDDVGNRSRTAAWHNEAGEDSVYVSWHTNAPNPGRGTSTYVYGPNEPNGTLQFSGVAGSLDLANLLQDEIVGDIRSAFDPNWNDRGVYSAWFGELNPNNNPEMPAALIEAAFHATEADADYLEEPRFRQTLARAIYQAIAKYFAQRDGVSPTLVPEPPNRLRVVNGPASGQVTVSWDPPYTDAVGLVGDAATSYRVFMSRDGRGFDNGTLVEDGTTSLVVGNLDAGQPVFFKVVALNDGGASMPTPTVAAVLSCDGAAAPALAVMGFYRMDSALLPRDDLSPWALGDIKALRYWEVNTYDYLVEHAWAYATAGMAMDGAEATALEDGALDPAPYEAMIWQLGEESTVDETFSADAQAVVNTWLSQGDKVLIVSGAEVLWDLVQKGDTADAAFAASTFGVDYASDDADTYLISAEGPFQALPPLSISDGGDGNYGSYDAEYLDVLMPLPGATPLLTYDSGAGAAATWFEGPSHRALLMGFPFEAVRPATARAALANAIVELANLPLVGNCTLPPPDAPPELVPEPGPELPTDASGAETDMPRDASTTSDGEVWAERGSLNAWSKPSNSSVTVMGDDSGCAASRGDAPSVWWMMAGCFMACAVRRRRLRFGA